MQSCTNWTNTVKRAAAAAHFTAPDYSKGYQVEPHHVAHNHWGERWGKEWHADPSLHYGFYLFYCRMCIHGISSESVYKNVQLTTWHSCSGVSQFLASRLFKLVRDMSVTTELKSNVQIMLLSPFLSLSLSAGSNTFLQSTERKNKPQLILCLRL